MQASRSIGIVWPGQVTQGDFDEVERFVPAGVDLQMVGVPREPGPPQDITLERVLKLPESPKIEETAKELVSRGVSSIGYGCTSASYVRGVGGDRDISERITAATGLPATTTSSATVLALRHRGVSRVSVLSPHVDLLNERLSLFLEGSGFQVVRMKGLNMPGDIEELPPNTIREMVVEEVDHPDADGIFISCTGMRTTAVLDEMERMTGKPVVAANQATVWLLLRLAGAPAEMEAPVRA